MKFVGLLSGGKDSCYNIMKCIEYGHELVCLGNLHPPLSSEVEGEMNSYMYQTAGYNMLKYIAICMNKPLITKELSGCAIQQSLDYQETNHDEVEDLYQLLKEIKKKYPSIEGVSCGTIVSSYQRYRVENVCERLGLTPLTYLWQRSRKELLDEMISRGIDAVLVKVAGAGLLPEKHLGKSLSFLYPTICRLNEKYQLDYCGEGGEYESFVVDCPLFLTQRIEITQSQVVHDPEDPSVGNLWITECKLVDKDPPIPISDDVGGQITPQDGVDSSLLSSPVHPTCLPPYVPRRPQKYHPVELTFDCDGYSQSPLLLPSSRVHSPNSLDFSIANTCLLQLEDIFSQLSQMIPSSISSLADAVFVHLYVSDMSLFDTLNKCYCQHFAQTKYPPSRVCVAIPLPPGVFVAMEAILLAGSSQAMKSGPQSKRREVLHVRSLSEWAPLCIGPYSQANVLNNSLIYVAGQIPLDPATMKLIDQVAPHRFAFSVEDSQNDIPLGLRNDIYLSILNYSNILISLDSHLRNCLSGILYVSYANLRHLVCDSFSQRCNNYARLCMQDIYLRSSQKAKKSIDDTEEYDSDEENSLKLHHQSIEEFFSKFPFLSVFVSQLPRNANVEVEFIAVGNSLGEIFFDERGKSRLSQVYIRQHLPAVTSSVPFDTGHQQSLESPKSLIFAMPLWKCGFQQHPDPYLIRNSHRSDRISDDELVMRFPAASYSIQTQFTNLSACFAIGYTHLSMQNPESGSIFQIFITLFQEIFQSIVQRKLMDLHDLKAIKVFYPHGLSSYQDLRRGCDDAFNWIFSSIFNPPPCTVVQIIPTQYQCPPFPEDDSSHQYLLSAQFIFLNFLQIKSELWISSNQRS